MQSKAHSMLESVANVAIGFGIMLTAQKIIFPWFDIHVSTTTNVKIGLCFTVVSIARSFCLRRMFNWITTQRLNKTHDRH